MRTVKLSKQGKRDFLRTSLFFVSVIIIPTLAVSLVRTTLIQSLSHEHEAFAQSAVEGKALATRILYRPSRGGGAYTVDYVYKFAGSDYHGTSISTRWPPFKIKDLFEIYVNSNAPEKSMPVYLLALDKQESSINQSFNHYLLAVVILFILLVELLIFWMMRRTYLVLKNGEILEATIVKTILGLRNKPLFAIIQFNIFGKTIEQKIVAYRDRDCSVGSKLKVAYWQELPTKIVKLPDPNFDT